jgi:hypothetical protein
VLRRGSSPCADKLEMVGTSYLHFGGQTMGRVVGDAHSKETLPIHTCTVVQNMVVYVRRGGGSGTKASALFGIR